MAKATALSRNDLRKNSLRVEHPILSTRHAFSVERLRNDINVRRFLAHFPQRQWEASLKEALLVGIQFLSAVETCDPDGITLQKARQLLKEKDVLRSSSVMEKTQNLSKVTSAACISQSVSPNNRVG